MDIFVTMRKDGSHFEITGGQSDDAGLVQLISNGARKWQKLRQLQKFLILLNAARPRCIFAFLFHHDFLQTTGRGASDAVWIAVVVTIIIVVMVVMMMMMMRAQIQRIWGRAAVCK